MTTRSTIGFTLFWGLEVLLFSACSGRDSGCSNNSDCTGGKVCVDSRCVVNGFGVDLDADADVDSLGDTTSGDSDSDADSDTADTSAVSTDTGCSGDPTVDNGAACSSDCQCFSGHCNNGFCCDNGECCTESADCNFDLCATPVCSDAMCTYVSSGYECGASDMTGWAHCSEGEVCDGAMDCIPLVDECGFFAAKPGVDCSGVEAVVNCYSSCTEANQATTCKAGGRCYQGQCVDENAVENGQECGQDSECISGHCGDGFCCADGECCATSADCSDECRENVVCGTNFQCIATFTGCGKEDLDFNQKCSGANRCDGAGNCVQVTTCLDQSSTFGSDGTYSCDSGAGIVSENCLSSCTANSQCAPGTQCDLTDHTCKAPPGGACTDDIFCLGGRCNNGYCCDAGTCCATAADCDTPCTTGNTCLAGVFSCQQTGANLACGEQSATCTGNNRCDGAGSCVAVSDSCGGSGIDSYSCARGVVSRECGCTTNDDCDDDNLFCNGTYLCSGGICQYDIRLDACTGNLCNPSTCDEVNDVCVDGANPCAATATSCDPGLCRLDANGNSYTCESNPLADGSSCDDGNACNGNADRCLSGVCTAGPLSTAPCFDNNPCTTDICIDNGDGTTSCSNPGIAIGQPCSADFGCYGQNATCEIGAGGAGVSCVASEAVCESVALGVCRIYTCQEDFARGAGAVTCSEEANVDYKVLSCNSEVTLTAADFTTRNVFFYGGTCNNGLEYAGMETVVYLKPELTDVIGATVTVTQVTPSSYGNVELFLLGQVCNPDSCVVQGTKRLNDIELPGDSAYLPVIVDSADEFWPADSITLRLSCP